MVALGVNVNVDRGQLLDLDRHRADRDSSSSGGSSTPELCWWLERPALHASAISPAVHPPSRYSTACSAGWLYSVSLSPPIPIAWPVTSRAASDARNTTSGAHSSGIPIAWSRRTARGSGPPGSTGSTSGAERGMLAVICVQAVGTIAFTVIWLRASSRAQVRAKATIPALAAA